MNGELTKIDNIMHDPETWVDLYGDILYRFALSRVKDSSVAEDLVQETFILREIDGLSTKEICEALNITAANCWVMNYRARRKLRPCTETCWLNGTE